ncbi:MAG: hypothetical protein Q7K43_02350 [Candidatus Woesearchaeota archaeon]|nr:hypothetical protein [Candidatus Woesearchaeota archaeon]
MNPEQKYSASGITATVWTNSKDGKTFHTVSFDKRYKDKEGNWKSTNSLNVSDLPKAIMVLGKAFEYAALKNPQTSPHDGEPKLNSVSKPVNTSLNQSVNQQLLPATA